MRILASICRRLFPNPTYYGWAIVGLGFLASALSSPGQSYVVALYLDPLMADLGLSRVQISSLYATATLAAAACLPFVGGWADRIPSGRFLSGVLGLIALAMVGLASVKSVAGLGIAFFFLRLLAQGAVGLGTLTATVRWFHRYRGRALAVVGIGYSFGQLVFPGLVYGLMATLGWRGSLLLMAAAYLLVAVPLVGRLMRERRGDDSPIDGCEPVLLGGDAAAQAPQVSCSLREALRMPVFWGLLACVSIPPLVHTAVVFHQVALFASVGWEAALVPFALMVSALAAVVSSYATGVVLERVPSRLGIALSLGLSALAFAAVGLPVAPVVGALVYGVLLGLAGGTNAAANSIVWPDYFGVESLGAVKGVVNAVRNGATALGPPIAAVLVAASGSFASSLMVFAVASLAGAVAVLWLRKPGAAPAIQLGSPVPEVPSMVPSSEAGRAA